MFSPPPAASACLEWAGQPKIATTRHSALAAFILKVDPIVPFRRVVPQIVGTNTEVPCLIAIMIGHRPNGKEKTSHKEGYEEQEINSPGRP